MLMRTDPYRELDRPANQIIGTVARPVAMPIDACRKADVFYVHFDLPGVRPDDIDLTVKRNVLTVHAERRGPPRTRRASSCWPPSGRRARSPGSCSSATPLDSEKLQADYDAGVLTVRLSVAESAKPRKLNISSNADGARQIDI